MAGQKYQCKVETYPEGELLGVWTCRSGREAMEFASVIEEADEPPYSKVKIEALDSTKRNQATHWVTVHKGPGGGLYRRTVELPS